MTRASCSLSLWKAAESIRTHVQFSYPHRPRQLASIPSPALPQPYHRKHPVAFASRKVITRPHRSTNVLYCTTSHLHHQQLTTVSKRLATTLSPLSRLASQSPNSITCVNTTSRLRNAQHQLSSTQNHHIAAKKAAEKHNGIPALTTGPNRPTPTYCTFEAEFQPSLPFSLPILAL
jgi:hypothetical protein